MQMTNIEDNTVHISFFDRYILLIPGPSTQINFAENNAANANEPQCHSNSRFSYRQVRKSQVSFNLLKVRCKMKVRHPAGISPLSV
ncbi:MAG: hypothetical protein ACLFWL_18015, partial [Candidatus Brocadiia bacterium]